VIDDTKVTLDGVIDQVIHNNYYITIDGVQHIIPKTYCTIGRVNRKTGACRIEVSKLLIERKLR